MDAPGAPSGCSALPRAFYALSYSDSHAISVNVLSDVQ